MQPAGGGRVEFSEFFVEDLRAVFLRLPHQLAAQRPVGGRPLEDAVEQAAQVERRAADEQRRPAARADFLEGGAGRSRYRARLKDSLGSTTSRRWNGTASRIARVGLPVPMSRPRYTFIESTEMSSALVRPATQTATAAFPEAVCPVRIAKFSPAPGGPASPNFRSRSEFEDHRSVPPRESKRDKWEI